MRLFHEPVHLEGVPWAHEKKPATNTAPAVKMNGGSLPLGMGRIIYRSMIYGSESRVMVKPGMFADNFGLPVTRMVSLTKAKDGSLFGKGRATGTVTMPLPMNLCGLIRLD